MKTIITFILTVVTLTTYSQTLVYTSGEFTVNDAVRVAQQQSVGSAIAAYEGYEGYEIYSNGTINGHDLGSLENVLELFENCKTATSTDYYTITKSVMGSVTVKFSSSGKEYTVTPYLRKQVIKAIKTFLS